jgi:hypothetical protein
MRIGLFYLDTISNLVADLPLLGFCLLMVCTPSQQEELPLCYRHALEQPVRRRID